MKAAFLIVASLPGIAALSACSSSPRATHTHSHTDPAFTNEVEAAQHFLKPIFSILDCEGEGEVEPGEVDEHFSGLFFYVDRDLDKNITEEELVSSAHHSHPSKERYLFALMDTDRNGVVSGSEFRNYLIHAVSVADHNQDGMLTPDEVGIETIAHSHAH